MAKKLLIIGGHSKQFSQTQATYQAALAAGIGEAKVVLPEGVQKYTKGTSDCLFVAETKSGSFAKAAYPDIAGFIKESDGVLLAGEFSSNSETVILLEQILNGTKRPVVISSETLELMHFNPQCLFAHQNRVLLAPTQQLAKLADGLEIAVRIKPQGLLSKAELAEKVSQVTGLDVVLLGHELVIRSQDKCSVTTVSSFAPDLFALARALLATFWLQHEQKFEALSSAAFVLSKIGSAKDQSLAGSLKLLEDILSEYSP